MMVVLLLFQGNFRHAPSLLVNAINLYMFLLLTSRFPTLTANTEIPTAQQSML